jgi:regulator of protease activity HflC (stomatin/prohibitin superfamily)
MANNKNYYSEDNMFDKIKGDMGNMFGKFKFLGSLTAIVIFLLLVFLLIFNPIAIVGVGERGVKVTLGKTSPESFGEGVHFVTPFISHMHKMDVKTVKSNIETMAQSKDIQQAKIVYVVNYNLKPEYAPKMYREVGKDYLNVIISPTVEGIVKDVIGKWNAQDIVANREKVASEILTKLRADLGKKYINVSDFQITEIQYSNAFEQAIENKVTAEQDALKAKNVTIQVQEEARQKVIAAEAEAKSMAIRAQALTQNKALVEYEAVKKWDGKLPEYMLGNSVPFINLKNK